MHKDSADVVVEPWYRQEIIRRIIGAQVAGVSAVAAGQAADSVIELLSPYLATPSPAPAVAEGLAAALVVMARNGIPPDLQELVIHGDPDQGIPPGILQKAFAAYSESLSAIRANGGEG